jgi:hypothetical protein
MFVNVMEAAYLEDYTIRVEFDNGIDKDIDLAGELHEEHLSKLRDMHYFNQVFINPDTNTVEWPCGESFDPEFLYEIGKELHKL